MGCHSFANDLIVFMHTSTFKEDPIYSNGASARFAATTNDTGEVVGLAVRPGERCGVMDLGTASAA